MRKQSKPEDSSRAVSGDVMSRAAILLTLALLLCCTSFAQTQTGYRAFDGTSSDYLTAADSTSLRSPSSAFTIAAWLKFTSSTQNTYAVVFGKKRTASGWSYLFQQNSTNNREVYLAAWVAGASHSTAMSSALTLNTWFFVVGRWTSGGMLLLDVYNADGSSFWHSDSTSTYTGTVGYDTGAVWVGQSESGTAKLQGQVTNIYIHNASLSDADVQTLLAGTLPTGNPSAAWVPFCGNSPENDLSTNGNNLTVNGTTFNAAGPTGIVGCVARHSGTGIVIKRCSGVYP